MSKRDIARTERKGGILIVECSKPDATRFAEPPLDAELDVQARAAMQLVRWIIGKSTTYSTSNSDATQFFVRTLLDGGRPPSVETVKKAKP
jgi:hypothetical protein